MNIITVASVSAKVQANGSTLFRITASNGTKYATPNGWIASFCQRAVETQTPIRVWSSAGWYYRTLDHVEPVEKQEAAS